MPSSWLPCSATWLFAVFSTLFIIASTSTTTDHAARLLSSHSELHGSAEPFWNLLQHRRSNDRAAANETPNTTTEPISNEDYKTALCRCYKELHSRIKDKGNSAMVLRMSFHDAGTYNKVQMRCIDAYKKTVL